MGITLIEWLWNNVLNTECVSAIGGFLNTEFVSAFVSAIVGTGIGIWATYTFIIKKQVEGDMLAQQKINAYKDIMGLYSQLIEINKRPNIFAKWDAIKSNELTTMIIINISSDEALHNPIIQQYYIYIIDTHRALDATINAYAHLYIDYYNTRYKKVEYDEDLYSTQEIKRNKNIAKEIYIEVKRIQNAYKEIIKDIGIELFPERKALDTPTTPPTSASQ